jgi:hypothetical protein
MTGRQKRLANHSENLKILSHQMYCIEKMFCDWRVGFLLSEWKVDMDSVEVLGTENYNDNETYFEVDDETSRDENEIVDFKYTITSYGADYPVDGLVKRLSAGNVFIPDFQREYVWTISDASSFIESFLLGLPVPGIFLSRDETTQKLLVIDGQQRLKSLEYFYKGVFEPTGRAFALQGVQEQYKGKTYQTLNEEDRIRLDDSIIHATIMHQDVPTEDNSSIYYVFERLNNRGRRLFPQEIRSSIYYGPFKKLLEELNRNRYWRQIYGRPSNRLKDHELILRFFALYFDGYKYKRSMKEFLNMFMGSNKELQRYSQEQLSTLFNSTIKAIYECLGEKAFKPEGALNAAVLDAVMVGAAWKLEKAPIKNCEAFREKYQELLQDPRFLNAYIRSTANEEQVQTRILLATEAFSNLQ